MAIVSIATGFAVAAFRGESSSRILERASQDFRAFCSQVRFRAAEEGCDWGVYFDRETRTFSARAVYPPSSESGEDSSGAPPSTLRWRPPEKLEFGDDGIPEESAGDGEGEGTKLARQLEKEEAELFADSDAENSDPAEAELGTRVMLFYSDGSAGSGFRLIFHCGELSRAFEVSPLSGRLIEVDDDPDAPAASEIR